MRDGGIAILTSCGVCLLDPSRRPVNRFQLVGVVSEWGSLNLLPNGHVLLAGRMGFYVNELGKDGETAWEYEGYQLSSAARLPNGHTLICVPREDRLLEVDRRGKEIRSFKVRGRPWHVEVIP